MTVVSAVSGCATPLASNQARATLYSNPPGATISSGNMVYGATPQTLTFTSTDRSNSFKSSLITATWISGAKTSTYFNLAAGQSGIFTFQRPSAPNLDADVQWAMQLQQQKTASDEATAAAFAETAPSIGNSLGQALGTVLFHK